MQPRQICAQTDTTVSTADTAKARVSFTQRVQKLAAMEAQKSIQEYKEGRNAIEQNQVMEQVQRENQRVKIYMQKGVDTLGINNEIEKCIAYLAIVKDGILVNKGTAQTQRNLAVSSTIVTNLLSRMTKRKSLLDLYTENLIGFKSKMDSLGTDSAIYHFPSDSAELIKYVRKLVVLNKEVAPVDSSMKQTITSLQGLQNRLNLLVYELKSVYEEIENYRRDLTVVSFQREFENIWGPVGFSRSFSEILRFSIAKEELACRFYIQDNIGLIFILFILIGIAWFFIRSLKNTLVQGKHGDKIITAHLLFRNPFLSASIIVISIFQFIFIDPPFIFSCLLWGFALISLTIIFRSFISAYWFRFWLIMFGLFALACFTNFILQASRTERWILLALSFSGMVYSCFVLFGGHRNELKERRILYFIVFVAIVETASFFLNIFGRYNVSKTLLTIGYIGVIIAILFLWTVTLLNEGLSFGSKLYSHPNRNTLYINFEKVGNKVPPLFYVLLIVGWFVVVGRNFYVFKQIEEPISDFLSTERTLGDYTFSVSSIVIFLVVVVCSMILSRLISIFSADVETTNTQGKKSGAAAIGSWILLIRICIISLGLFLAFAAAGIPLDKITIILGALGVGIGLGLQGLVNNLVSGLIIAFEKPVNVGDIIEVGGQMGTMKSIGFRSSVVTLIDGACIIIPNGDLLNNHLINWTMAKNMRRLTITVGVAYGTDLQLVKELLTSILISDERIAQAPVPLVLTKHFAESAIEFDMIFWIKNIRETLVIKSDVITATDRVFKNAGIVIPFPQRDVHIQNTAPPDKSSEQSNEL